MSHDIYLVIGEINMHDLPNKLSIEKCRKLISGDNKYSDEQVRNIRNVLYKLAGVVIQKYEQIRNFITRTVTLDARGKIIK